MPNRKLPDYQLDRNNHIYRSRRGAGVWWWQCTCSLRCWTHQKYRSKQALRAHQTQGGRECCPVDINFEPPVHAQTVEAAIEDHARDTEPVDGLRGSGAHLGRQPCFPPAHFEQDEDTESVDQLQEGEHVHQGCEQNEEQDGSQNMSCADEVHDAPFQDPGVPEQFPCDDDQEGEWFLDEDDIQEDAENQDAEEQEVDAMSDQDDEDYEHEPAEHEALNNVLHARMVQLLESNCLPEDALEETDDGAEHGGWAQARYKRVNCRDHDSQLVSDYAYDHVKLYRENVQSRKCADKVLRMNATRLMPNSGEPDPAGYSNCFPPSIAACEAILGVGDLSKYVIHMCPNGCEHWWTFMKEYRTHYKACGGCAQCRCPHCGAHRFLHDKKGIRGASICWLFFDIFQTMMLDVDLATAVFQGRTARNITHVPDSHPSKPSLAKYREGKRLLDELPNYGFDVDKVLMFGVAFDGLPMGKKYTVNMHLLRCRDAPPSLAVSTQNVNLLMLTPGPKDPPQGFAAHTNLLLHFFHAFGPNSDATLESRQLLVPQAALAAAGLLEQQGVHCANGVMGNEAGAGDEGEAREEMVDVVDNILGANDVATESSDYSDASIRRQEPLHRIDFQPVLSDLTCDWPGRSKLTNWSGHSAQFNGGWCMCNQFGTAGQGGPRIHGYTQAVEQPFLVDPLLRGVQQGGDGPPNWWTNEGTARRLLAQEAINNESEGGETSDYEDSGDGSDMEASGHDADEEECDEDQEVQVQDERDGGEVAGNQQQIPFRRAYTMHLSEDDLESMGHFAHKVQQAIKAFKSARDKSKLQELGIQTMEEAKIVIRHLGRKDRLPWTAAYFKQNMPYIRSRSLVLLPPAHMLLHGIVKTFLGVSFGHVKGWSTRTACDERPFLLSKKALDSFKADWDAVDYPHVKGRKPQDPAAHILTYKMEEVGDLLWVGGLAAVHACAQWREAWAFLREACEHYLFGFDANEAQCRRGHQRLWAYAECCEQAVIAKQAPESLLTPNLHAATCRLLYQELQRGPAALESEWWMERFFLEPKCLVAGVGRVAPEITYMKSCILLDRALKMYKARYPDIEQQRRVKVLGPDTDPNHALDQTPYLLGKPIVYTERVAGMCKTGTGQRNKVTVAHVVDCCVKVLLDSFTADDCPPDEFERWRVHEAAVAEDRLKVLSCAKVLVFHRCRMSNFLVSSELSPKQLVAVGKSEASSYCLAYVASEDGARELVPCWVKFFLLIKWKLDLGTSRMAAVCPVPFRTSDAESRVFGQTVFRFDKAEFDRTKADIDNVQVVTVEDIVRPFIVIKVPPGPNRCMWRLVQFQGKLLGTFDECDFWQDENAA